MTANRWITLLAVLVLSCGGKDKNPQSDAASPNNSSQDLGGDRDMGGGGDDTSAPADMGAGDVANNVFDPGGCAAGIMPDVTLDIDTGAYAGQFYARTAWDGEGAWVVYNRRNSMEANAPEEIFAVRVGCDGSIQHGPLQLSIGNGERNYMPVIASRGGMTHVAWVEENTNPSKIWLALLAQDGTVVLGDPVDITPSTGGTPVSMLTWEPDIAVWDDGTGVVAVTAGNFGATQIWLQRYGTDGSPSADAFVVYDEPGAEQKRATIAAGADGTVYVAWTRYKPEDTTAGTPEEPEQALFTSIPAGANMAFPAFPLPAKPLTTPNPIARYSREPGPGGAFYLAFQVTTSMRQDILVRDGTDFETADSATFGSAGFANFRPSIAAGKAGGVLAWYRYDQTPLKNTVMLHPFDNTGGAFAPGTEVAIETSTPGIPPYGPDVTSAGGNVYFVVWGEGDTAPEARVKGRWVVL